MGTFISHSIFATGRLGVGVGMETAQGESDLDF